MGGGGGGDRLADAAGVGSYLLIQRLQRNLWSKLLYFTLIVIRAVEEHYFELSFLIENVHHLYGLVVDARASWT